MLSLSTIIRISSPDGTQRRRLPKKQIVSSKWTRQRYGGYADCTLETSAEIGGLSTIIPGDRVDIYRTQPGEAPSEANRRYRGYVTARNVKENAGGPDTLTIQAFGVSFFLRKQPCRENYAFPIAGSDIGDAFAAFAKDNLLPSLGPNGRPYILSVSADKIGTGLSALQAQYKIAGDVLDEFTTQMGNLGGWGGDVDPQGDDRVYMRAAKPLSPPTHTIPIPHKQAEVAGGDFDTADVVTRLIIEGGPPTFPQKLHNGNFEQPVLHQELQGNLLRDGDFETKDQWTQGGSAYQGTDFNGTYKGQPFSGQVQVELDHVGEYIEQIETQTFTVGHNYTLGVRARKGFGDQTASGTGILEWRTAGGAVIGTAVTFPVTPLATDWEYFSTTAQAPTGAGGYRVRFECDALTPHGSNQGGLYLDAAELFDSDVAYQDGWQALAYGQSGGNPHFNWVNWLCKDSFEGGYAVSLEVVANDAFQEDAHLEPLNQTHAPVTGQQTVRFGFWYKSPAGATQGIPKMLAVLRFFASDGHETNLPSPTVVINAQAVNSAWQYAEIVSTANGDSVGVLPIIDFRSNGQIVVDALSLRDSAAPVFDGSGHYLPYQPEGNVRFEVACSDAGLAAAYPAGALIYGGYETTYGVRAKAVSEPAILVQADAYAYADNLFRGAGPYMRPLLTLTEWPEVFDDGDSVYLTGKDGAKIASETILVARVEESDDGLHRAALSLEREQPDTISIVKELLDEERRNMPSVGGGGATSTQTNADTGSAITPSYYGTSFHDADNATLHDAFAPDNGPHVQAAERTAWDGTTAEVIAARTDTAAAVSYLTLEARLDAMNAAIAAAGADTSSRILSGGAVTPGAGLTAAVAPAEYLLSGVQYSYAGGMVAFAAADATNPRFDLVAFDATGAIVITGTPDPDPGFPAYDPSTQITDSYVLIAAGATSVGTPNVDVFHEGTEWTGAASNGTWSLSTATPHAGTHDLAVNGTSGAYTLTAPAAVASSAVTSLTLWVNISSWPGTRSVSVWFQQPGGTKRAGVIVALKPGAYGLTTSTGTYQQVTIPLTAFSLSTGASLGGLKMSLAGSGGAVVAAVDDIVLTGSVGTGTITQTGDLNFSFAQSSPASTWNITHSLGKFPSVTIVDSSGNLVMGDVLYNDMNTVTLSFGAAFAGSAYLN